jgi:uncharacterized lipoprotein YmbA
MIQPSRLRPFLLGLLAVVVTAGCASHEPLASYYVLTSDAAADARSGTQAGLHGARIFIRRVDVPGYLQTTKFTSRQADNQIQYSTAAQWAEPLNEGIADALTGAINRTSRATVVGAIGGGVPPARDDDLKVAIERCEGDDQGDVVLVATWSLFAPEASTPLLTRRSRFVQHGWKYGDYASLAKLLGLDIKQLGDEIARAAQS